MLSRINTLRETIPGLGGDSDNGRFDPGFAPLRALAAELLLITGVEATRGALAGERSQDEWPARPTDFARERSARWPYAAMLAPALLAPLAAAAHLKHMVRPSPSTSTANRLLNAAVLGVGLIDLVGPLLVRGGGAPKFSLAPLVLASAGLLGLVVERQEQTARDQRKRLERRAKVVERLVPKRRPRLDRIVVHV